MRVIRVWMLVSNSFLGDVTLWLLTNLIRAWDQVALAGDEGVAVARGYRYLRLLLEVCGIASVFGNAR